jgi:uncharacterized membrane protein HdeD (DUF308 family)
MNAGSQMLAERSRAGDQERLQQNWLLLLAMGLILIGFGAVVIAEPFVATGAVVQILGVLLVFAGIFQVASSVWGRRWQGFILHLLTGVLYLFLGIFMIENTAEAAAGLTLLVAISLLVSGVLRIALSLTQRFDCWAWVLVTGVVSVILGAAIWRHWPNSANWVIGLFVGIELLFSGLSWVMVALRVRAEPKGPLAA